MSDFLTCVTETVDKATGRRAVVSGVGRSAQHKQVGGVDPLIPGGQARQPPFCIFAVRRASRAGEVVLKDGECYIQETVWGKDASSAVLHKIIPVKYTEVESESSAADHAVVWLSGSKVVGMVPH